MICLDMASHCFLYAPALRIFYYGKLIKTFMLHSKQERLPILQWRYKLIERAEKQKKMEWKQVTYSKFNVSIPSERWGHRMVSTRSNQLVLFGGFGGGQLEGRYLGDVWSFSIASCTWQQFATSGRIPQNRSNYTLHYDDVNNNIILFGGSSEQKVRSNTISILNWTRKDWTEYQPAPNNQAPWERTYHSSEYYHPYLIIHGGEGGFGQDLDDMWVFDVERKWWSRLHFNESAQTPKKRRFHSTALFNHYFYLMGGCSESYVLLGDMYRVNLQELFEKRQFSGFEWECVCSHHEILNRWGHSSLVYGQQIYIVGGRISGNTDYDFGASFDPISQQLTALRVHQTTVLPSRRRQASVVVGNSLLIFGGFNGKYMNDFYYLSIGDTAATDFQCVAMSDRHQLMEELEKQQQRCEGDITIKLSKHNKVQFVLKSHRFKLVENEFFANLMKFSPQGSIYVELPQFCDVTAFRLVHLSLIQKQILFCSKFSIQYWINVALTFEYLVCGSEMQAFGKQLSRMVIEENCLQLLQVATELKMQNLKRTAAEVYFLHHDDPPKKHRYSESTVDSNFQTHPHTLEEIGKSERESPYHLISLEEIYETIRFDVEQKKLKGRGGFLSRFKSVFRRQNPEASSVISESRQVRGQEIGREADPPGCFHRLIAFLARICESSENRHRQLQN